MNAEEVKAKREQAKAKLAEEAALYARVFLGSDDGKKLLRSLRAKFDNDASFIDSDTINAALRDGRRQVISEIDAALKAHSPQQWAASLIS